jgi:transposase-like protein
VKLADEVGITEAAKRLDMPTSSIRNWMKPEARSRLNAGARKGQPVSETQAEITRLRVWLDEYGHRMMSVADVKKEYAGRPAGLADRSFAAFVPALRAIRRRLK